MLFKITKWNQRVLKLWISFDAYVGENEKCNFFTSWNNTACCNEKIMETAEIDRSCSSCEETICSLRGAATWYGQWPFLKRTGRDWRSEDNRNRENVIHFCTEAMSAWLACKRSTKHFPYRVVSGIHHFAKYDTISWRIFIANFKVKSRLSPVCISSKTVFHVFEVQYTKKKIEGHLY